MPVKPLCQELIEAYILSILSWDIFKPLKSLEETKKDLETNTNVLLLLEQTCYLNHYFFFFTLFTQTPVDSSGPQSKMQMESSGVQQSPIRVQSSPVQF